MQNDEQLEAEATRLLADWAIKKGVSLRSLGILGADRLALVARREVPLFLIENDRAPRERRRETN